MKPTGSEKVSSASSIVASLDGTSRSREVRHQVGRIEVRVVRQRIAPVRIHLHHRLECLVVARPVRRRNRLGRRMVREQQRGSVLCVQARGVHPCVDRAIVLDSAVGLELVERQAVELGVVVLEDVDVLVPVLLRGISEAELHRGDGDQRARILCSHPVQERVELPGIGGGVVRQRHEIEPVLTRDVEHVRYGAALDGLVAIAVLDRVSVGRHARMRVEIPEVERVAAKVLCSEGGRDGEKKCERHALLSRGWSGARIVQAAALDPGGRASARDEIVRLRGW